MKLTNIQCKNSTSNDSPSKTPRKLADGDGFYLWVMPTGRRYWRFRYKDVRGKYRELALGVYPEISLLEARDKTRERTAINNSTHAKHQLVSLVAHLLYNKCTYVNLFTISPVKMHFYANNVNHKF